MKRFLLILLAVSSVTTASFAQRFQVGARIGANLSDYSTADAKFTEGTFYRGSVRAGFEAAILFRLNITRHLNLQTEFEYDRANYDFRYSGPAYAQRNVRLHADRIEIPLLLGIDAGPVRLFGGASFRAAHSENSSAPSLLRLKFNDSDVALTGGAGLKINKFFIEGRISGYPKKSLTNKITSKGETLDIKVCHNIKWTLTAGFFF